MQQTLILLIAEYDKFPQNNNPAMITDILCNVDE